MEQHALTVITPVLASEAEPLETLLTEIGSTIRDNPYIRFAAMERLHFACWIVLQNDPKFPPQLVMETNYDGDLDAHLNELIANGGHGLDAIYRKCEGYPAEGMQNPQAVKEYFRRHSVETEAFYIGCPGQSVESIRNAIAVREEIERFLDKPEVADSLECLPPSVICARIAAHLRQTPDAIPMPSSVTLDQQKENANRNLFFWILMAVPVVLLLLPLLLVGYLFLRVLEMRDAAQPPSPPRPVDQRLFGKEDIFTQNHLTTLVNVKPGAFRLGTLKLVLWIINSLAKAYFITGHLGGIPTIHFARWILMDNDRRLLFFSNYDGSWASYLGDFVDKANFGLTAVWGNTEDFPPSHHLFFGGAQHIEEFKRWSREHNGFAPLWYSAYPEETLVNLRNDLQIRDAIDSPLSDEDALRLLQRL